MAQKLLRRQDPDLGKTRLLLTATLMQGSAQRDECKSRQVELRKSITRANEIWQSFEAQLEHIEEAIYGKFCQRLHHGKGELQTGRENPSEDGARNMVRHRLHSLVVLPLRQSMEEYVGLDSDASSQDSPHAKDRNLVAEMSEQCDSVVDAIDEAVIADKALDKSIKATEKEEKARGIVSLGMQDTKKVAALKCQRPGIWEVPRCKLDELTGPAQRLTDFVEEEMSPHQLTRRLAQAPAIVIRAAGDWHFERCVTELGQLQSWWGTTKGALSGNGKLWDGLQSKEGLFIQRIEKGFDEVATRKQRYSAYANFGAQAVISSSLRTAPRVDGNSKEHFWTQSLEESSTLIGHVLSEMHDGLNQIRNSAMWRVVESGRQIQKELEAPALWDTIAVAEGCRVVLACVDTAGVWPERPDGEVPLEDDFLEEMLLIAMRRLDCLIEMSTEVRDFFDKDGLDPREDVVKCGDTLAKLLADMNEELLAVLDEPSIGAVHEWLQLWSNWDGDALAQELEACIKETPFQKLGGEALRLRQQQLLRLRGLQTLAGSDKELRMKVVSALNADITGVPRSPTRSRDQLCPLLPLKKVQEMAAVDALRSEPPPLTSTRPECPETPSSFGGSVPDTMRRGATAAASPDAQRRGPGKTTPDVSLNDFLVNSDFLAGSPAQWKLGGVESRARSGSRGGSRTTVPASVPFNAKDDLWNVSPPVLPVAYSEKSLSKSSSSPSLRGPRGIDGARHRDREQPLAGVVRAPSVKFVDGERIPLRPGTPQMRLDPLSRRPGSSTRRPAPSLAWT